MWKQGVTLESFMNCDTIIKVGQEVSRALGEESWVKEDIIEDTILDKVKRYNR